MLQTENLSSVTREQFVQAVQAGHETLTDLMAALDLTRNQARHLRDTLVTDEVIEPYAVAESHTRGQRAYRYRVVTERRGVELSRVGHRIVQEAIGSLHGHSGPFAVLLSTAGGQK